MRGGGGVSTFAGNNEKYQKYALGARFEPRTYTPSVVDVVPLSLLGGVIPLPLYTTPLLVREVPDELLKVGIGRGFESHARRAH